MYSDTNDLQNTLLVNTRLETRAYLVTYSQADLSSVHVSTLIQPFFRILRIISPLKDGGMPALTCILFTQKFPIFSCKILVWNIIFYFSPTDRFGRHPWFPFLLFTAKSPVLFLMSKYSSFRVLSIWSHHCYFQTTFTYILMQISPVYWYFKKNSLECSCHS